MDTNPEAEPMMGSSLNASGFAHGAEALQKDTPKRSGNRMDKTSKNPIEQVLKDSFSYTTARNASSWDSNMVRWPIGASSNSGACEDNFLNAAKMEEEKGKATKIKPYPLDFINDLIVTNYTNLASLKKTLVESLKYPDMSNADIAILKKEIKNVSIMIAYMQKMYYNVDKIAL